MYKKDIDVFVFYLDGMLRSKNHEQDVRILLFLITAYLFHFKGYNAKEVISKIMELPFSRFLSVFIIPYSLSHDHKG